MTRPAPLDIMVWLRLFRHRMVNLLLGTVTVLGTVGILYVVSTYILNGWRVSARLIGYLIAYFLLATLFAMRRLPVVWRALGLLTLVYAFAIFSFVNGWLGSNARPFLLALTVLSGILIGPRAGMIAAVLSLVTYAVFGLAFAQGWLIYEIAPAHAQPAIILIEGIGFAMAMGMVGIGLWFIRVGLAASTQATVDAEQARALLAERAEQLNQANRLLAEHSAQLEAANQELEAFSYSVSHDLRAPVRHIDGFVHLLVRREGERLDPTSQRYLNSIAQSAGKMGQLIDDLLALSRTGRTDMQLQRVDLDELVRSARTEALADVQDRQIDWQIAPLPTVEGDPILLRQVWVNLLSNAVKYTQPREDARIEIGFLQENTTSATPVIPSLVEASPSAGGESPNSYLTLYVRDNGVGFDPRYAHKLFGVFQRLHPEDEFEGTGIGLAIVRRIVCRHGGRVWAESEPDRGATFYLTLKVAGIATENRSRGETSTT